METKNEINTELDLKDLLRILSSVDRGDFTQRMPEHLTGIEGKIADTLNSIILKNYALNHELKRIGKEVGKEGKVRQRIQLEKGLGEWADSVDAVNGLIDNLLLPLNEITRVIGSVSKGDLSQTVNFEMDGKEHKMNDSFQTTTDQILLFTLDELAYGLPLRTVVRVIHAVEIRRLPKSPEIISGIINIQGQIIPVADIRKRFGLAEREIEPDDRMIIADTGKRKVALSVNTVTGIKDLATRQFVNSKEALPFAEHLRGVAKVDDELILIYDLEQFLSLDEEKELEYALKTKNK